MVIPDATPKPKFEFIHVELETLYLDLKFYMYVL
jgi:hypothetical protein